MPQMKNAEKQTLSNLQIELLKLYAQNVEEEDLTAIKKMIATYFAEKAMNEADRVWNEKSWDEKDSVRISKMRLRSSDLPK